MDAYAGKYSRAQTDTEAKTATNDAWSSQSLAGNEYARVGSVLSALAGAALVLAVPSRRGAAV